MLTMLLLKHKYKQTSLSLRKEKTMATKKKAAKKKTAKRK